MLNSLGELASRTSATSQAREHHSQALAIARDIGAPLEEARALEGIGHSYLQDGDPSQATIHLQQALALDQRIGSPDARRVYEALSQYGLQQGPTQLPRLRIWRHAWATSIQLPAVACDRPPQRNGRGRR